MKALKEEKEKLLTLQSEQRKELSGFDQMERELRTSFFLSGHSFSHPPMIFVSICIISPLLMVFYDF